MKAAVLPGLDQPIETRDDVELAPPGPGEVRIKMVASGVCHSDLSVQNGTIPLPTPIVLGHEGAGVIDAVGSAVEGLSIGDKVVIGPAFCGHCQPCLKGHPMYCVNFYDRNMGVERLDGSKAAKHVSRSGKSSTVARGSVRQLSMRSWKSCCSLLGSNGFIRKQLAPASRTSSSTFMPEAMTIGVVLKCDVARMTLVTSAPLESSRW